MIQFIDRYPDSAAPENEMKTQNGQTGTAISMSFKNRGYRKYRYMALFCHRKQLVMGTLTFGKQKMLREYELR